MNQVAQDVISDDRFVEKFDPRDEQVGIEKARRHDLKNVWTVVDADGALYALAGYHCVNRTGQYIITSKPWQTGLETVLLDCGCDVDEMGCEACACIPL